MLKNKLVYLPIPNHIQALTLRDSILKKILV